ncbi:MAG: DMT family transporter [Geminicoccaceae bacterium]
MLLAALCSSSMNAMIRGTSAELHAFEIAFFRNLFGLVALVPMLLRAGAGSLKTSRFALHGLRGVLNAVAMLSFFYAVSITPLAEVAALAFTSPLFATILAALVLRDRVGPRRIIGLLVGFAGALVIIRPATSGLSLGAGLIILSSVAWAAALVDIKILSRTETSLSITVYAALFLTPITLVAAIPFWQWPSLTQLLVLAVIGSLGSVTQMSIAQALRHGDTSQVMPADFTKLVWASLIGWLAFAEIPDVWVIVGGCMICGSVAYIAYRESRQRLAA